LPKIVYAKNFSEDFSAGKRYSRNRHLVRGRRVDPVELVGQRQQLELLHREVELPRVRHEIQQVRRGANRPVVNVTILETFFIETMAKILPILLSLELLINKK
jgi:hypothetical protein